MADIIAREMAIPSQLLEHVAGRTAKAILNELPMAQYVYISITKDNPPMGIDSMGGMTLGLSAHIQKKRILTSMWLSLSVGM